MSTNIAYSIPRMCHRVNDVMQLCCELSTNHQIRATFKGSSKGAAAAGGLALAGGIVGGPLGIAVGEWKYTKQIHLLSLLVIQIPFVLLFSKSQSNKHIWVTIFCTLFHKFESSSPVGGAVGGLLGCWLTSGQFKPLPQVLMELSPQQKKKLYDDLMVILGDIQWTDLIQLTVLVMSNATLKQQIIGALVGYVTKELQAEVHYVD